MGVRGTMINPSNNGAGSQDVAAVFRNAGGCDVTVEVGDRRLGVRSALKNSGVVCICCEFGLEAEC